MKVPHFFFLETYLESSKRNLAIGLKIYDSLACIAAFIGIVLALIEHEIYIKDALIYEEIQDSEGKTVKVDLIFNEEADSFMITLLRSIISVTTLISVCAIIKRYIIKWKYLKLKASVDVRIKANRKLYWAICLIEISLLIIHTPPKLNFLVSWVEQAYLVQYPIDTLVSIIMLGRLYLLWRVFHNFSFWNSRNSLQIRETLGCANNEAFALKSEMKYRPYKLTLLIVLCSIAILGIALRNAEIVFIHHSTLDWYSIWNGMWCMTMSMTAVGYGDYYPSTVIGRIIVIIGALWGNFLTSLFVVSLTNSIEFSFNQNQAYQMVKRGQQEVVLATKAANLLKFAILLWLRNGKTINPPEKSIGKPKFMIPRFFARKKPILDLSRIKKAYIESAIEFKKSRREIKAVLLLDLAFLKKKLPLYSNINKKIIENEVFQIMIQEKIEKLAQCQKKIYQKFGYLRHIGLPHLETATPLGGGNDHLEAAVAFNVERKGLNTAAFGLKEDLDRSDSVIQKVNEKKDVEVEKIIHSIEEDEEEENQRDPKENEKSLQHVDDNRVYQFNKTPSIHDEIKDQSLNENSVKVIEGIDRAMSSLKGVGSVNSVRPSKVIKDAPLRGLIMGYLDDEQNKSLDTSKQGIEQDISLIEIQKEDNKVEVILEHEGNKSIDSQRKTPKKSVASSGGANWKPLPLCKQRSPLLGLSEANLSQVASDSPETKRSLKNNTSSESFLQMTPFETPMEVKVGKQEHSEPEETFKLKNSDSSSIDDSN